MRGVDGEAIFEITHERSPARLPADLPREASPTIGALGTVLLRRSLRTAGGGENEESTMPWQAAHDGAITSVMETGCDADGTAGDGGRLRSAARPRCALHRCHRQPDHASGSQSPWWLWDTCPLAAPPGARLARELRWWTGLPKAAAHSSERAAAGGRQDGHPSGCSDWR
jgi:hypothetical protein